MQNQLPITLFEDISNKCVECNSSCKECSAVGANKCTICDSSKYLNPDNTCKTTCPENYYKKDYSSPATNKCELCHTTCKYCSGAYSN